MSEIGQKLIAAVRAQAAANPDKVYTPPDDDGNGFNCVNVFNGEGSCIVGCGALDSSIITPDFELDYHNGSGVHGLNTYLGNPLDIKEVNWLACVQGEQDRGTEWARAVSFADECYPLDAE